MPTDIQRVYVVVYGNRNRLPEVSSSLERALVVCEREYFAEHEPSEHESLRPLAWDVSMLGDAFVDDVKEINGYATIFRIVVDDWNPDPDHIDDASFQKKRTRLGLGKPDAC